MKTVKYIVRLAFLLIAVSLLIYLNRKTSDNTQSVAEFKIKMFESVRADSLNAREKLQRLTKGTSKFVDDSSRVRKGIQYLTVLFAVMAVTELSFIIIKKRNI